MTTDGNHRTVDPAVDGDEPRVQCCGMDLVGSCPFETCHPSGTCADQNACYSRHYDELARQDHEWDRRTWGP